MGPRPNGRGKPNPAVRPPCPYSASMGPRPNGRGKPNPPRIPYRVFVRQWGRGQTAAESARPCAPSACAASVNGAAAKRPRKAEFGPPAAAGPSCVNGAAAKRPRKEENLAEHANPVIASMGPRPNGRGKSWRLGGRGISPPRQWGRGQTAAESPRPGRPELGDTCVNGAAAKRPRKAAGPRARPLAPPASMGPRPNSRGKRIPIAGRAPTRLASMGPRPNGRGKFSDGDRAEDFDRRQWGRGQTAAESICSA